MIPRLEKLIRSKLALPSTADVSLLKLHNGFAYRNPKVSFVVFVEREPRFFLKTVRFPQDHAVIEHAFEALTSAHEMFLSVSAGHTPEPLWCSLVDAVPVMAETVVGGEPLHPQSREEQAAVFGLLRAWPAAARVGFFEHLSATVETWLSSFPEMPQSTLLFTREAFERSYALAGGDHLRLPRILAHGDLTPGNVLRDAKNRLTIIDWDRFGDIDWPLFDLFTFIERLGRGTENPFETHRQEIERQAEALSIPLKAIPLLLLGAAVLTEWRKRAHVHPFERERLNVEFDENVRLMCQWAEIFS